MAKSTPNVLDYQKHGLDLRKNQIDVTKNRVELMGKEPGAYEAEMGLLNDFQESNKTRKPGWQALLDGMVSGLKYGVKSAEGEKKRKLYDNMEKMLGSFEAAGMQLQKQNEENLLKQQDMETKVIPSAVGYLTYLQSNPRYDEAFNNLNSRVEQIKTVMNFDGDLVALSPRNYEVGIFKDRKTGQLKETPVSSLIPPDILKGRPDLNTYERTQDAEKLKIDQQNADAHTMSAEAKKNKYAPQPMPDLKEGELPLNSFSGEFRKGYEEGVLKNFQKIPPNQQAIKTVEEMSKIFVDHPDIGQSFIQLLDTKEDNILTTFGKRYAESKHPGLLSAMQRLRKLASDLSLDVILSVPGKTATDVFKQTVKDAAPNGKLTKEAFDSIAQNWITKANNNIQGATQGLQDLHRGVINAGSASMVPSSQEQQNQGVNANTQIKIPEGYVLVTDPGTGQTQALSPEEAKIAESRIKNR